MSEPVAYVLFTGRRVEHPLDRLSPPGFRHCLLFQYHPRGDAWVIYDVTRKGTSITALRGELFDRWLTAQRRNGGRVLRVWTDQMLWFEPRWSPLLCAPAVAHTIGSRSRALRPVALWRDLLKEGATEVFSGPS